MPQIVSESEYNEIATPALASTSPGQSREKLVASLPQIAEEVAAAMGAAGLDFPIFLVIPRSGNAIATVATVTDPTNFDWDYACGIACSVFERHTGKQNLRAHELPCISAGMPTVGVAELCAAVHSVGPNS